MRTQSKAPYRRASEQVGIRIKPKFYSQLVAWIERQPEDLSKPEAMRRLAAIGLSKASGRTVNADD
jgi:hypothetical protein